ncbi:MAG: GntR family transcriptional regulator [Hyphomonadaceae bacterium]|nr:GntR family transcriptional regulator [Hyphomonadaceae bacterium]
MAKQHAWVVTQIRELILNGALGSGERLAEAALAERLGVSRTPVRQALPLLAQEGLLAEAGARGFVVRGFSSDDILDAIDLRGALEGMAARRLAERGPSPGLLGSLRQALATGDAILERHAHGEEEEAEFAGLNGAFHDLIVAAADSLVIQEAIQRVNARPFVDPRAIAFEGHDPARVHMVLSYAHQQHHAIVAALESRSGARVEALMREHVQPVKDATNLKRRIDGADLAPPPRSERKAGLRHG